MLKRARLNVNRVRSTDLPIIFLRIITDRCILQFYNEIIRLDFFYTQLYYSICNLLLVKIVTIIFNGTILRR